MSTPNPFDKYYSTICYMNKESPRKRYNQSPEPLVEKEYILASQAIPPIYYKCLRN